ncbi:HAMP domain-containing histidine kinase [Neosynechococcus sphagnicola]|uniref:HAMP domain-containing histidine kinase n=1 Tax=Neosynechococcus sphagnicola TaxID=1501145 RepID=UPI00138E1A5F|nr:HAMP domain-containing histidine kinase [Neosynechococcus sphagnicola]
MSVAPSADADSLLLRLECNSLQRELETHAKILTALEQRVARSLHELETHLIHFQDAQGECGWHAPLDQLQAEVDGLCDLLSDAILLQKLEAGKVKVSLEVLDLQPLLVAASRHLLQPRPGGCQFICDLQAPLLPVLADQELTEAVIVDLLSRALRYSDAQATVRLEAAITDTHLNLHITSHRFAPCEGQDFAPEIALCRKRIQIQNVSIVCRPDVSGYYTVTLSFPLAAG